MYWILILAIGSYLLIKDNKKNKPKKRNTIWLTAINYSKITIVI